MFSFNQTTRHFELSCYVNFILLHAPVINKFTSSLLVSFQFGIERRLAPSDAANKPVIRSKWDEVIDMLTKPHETVIVLNHPHVIILYEFD